MTTPLLNQTFTNRFEAAKAIKVSGRNNLVIVNCGNSIFRLEVAGRPIALEIYTIKALA